MADTDVATTADADTDVIDTAPSCTKQEAEELVASAVTHANGLLDNLNEIWRRKAWEPLGFSSIGDLLKSPMVSEKILNPTTGKPYSREHLRRIAQTANLQAAVAEAAAIDPADLSVDERRLRELGAAGLRDVQRDVVDEIDRRQGELDEDSETDETDEGDVGEDLGQRALGAEEVQGIMDRGIRGDDVSGAPRNGGDPDSESEELDEADEAAIDAAAQQHAGRQDTEATEDSGQQGGASGGPAVSATDAFDAALNDDDDGDAEARGSRAPESAVTMKDALAAARVYGDTNASASRIEGLGEDLSRSLSVLESALAKGRETLSVVFAAGEAGHRLLEAENKAETLAASLSQEERATLADRLDHAADLGAVVEVVNELCQQITERQDVAELVDRLNLVQVQSLEAGQIARVCGVLSEQLRGQETEDDLEDLLGELGV